MERKDSKGLLWAALAAAMVLCLAGGMWYISSSLTGRSAEQGESGKHHVALVTKSTTSAFWQSVYAGARAASTEYNLTISFEGPDNEEDYETQNRLIETAVDNGAEAIVFSSVDYNENAAAIDDAAARGVKIIVIDSDVNSSQVSSRISTDNYEAGKMAGEAVLSCQEETLNIGIVNFDKNSANGQEREQGFREVTEADGRVTIAEAINVISTTEDAKAGTIQMLKDHPEINVIATFNEWTSLGVGYAVQELGLGEETMVVAFDSNVVSVGMLETGEVDALIVQNPYAMGYLSVEYAYNLIYGREVPQARVDTATTLITKENMFRPECQRILFTFD